MESSIAWLKWAVKLLYYSYTFTNLPKRVIMALT
jgi:hypothetical protein